MFSHNCSFLKGIKGGLFILLLMYSPVVARKSQSIKVPSHSIDPSLVGDLVVVGDVHGCPDCLQATLFANGVTDSDAHWIAGNRTVVQLGDLIGRGPDDPGVIAFVQRMQLEAAIAGGEWIQLLGNHEYMELNGDFRYANDGMEISPSPSPSPSSQCIGFCSLKARQEAFVNGEVGAWLRKQPIVYQWNDVVMVHGGISSLEVARLGVDEINAGYFRGDRQIADKILWDRRLSLDPTGDSCRDLDNILDELDATIMVVGHTITASIMGFEPGEIGERCGGKLKLADVGMSSAFTDIPKHHRAVHFNRD